MTVLAVVFFQDHSHQVMILVEAKGVRFAGRSSRNTALPASFALLSAPRATGRPFLLADGAGPYSLRPAPAASLSSSVWYSVRWAFTFATALPLTVAWYKAETEWLQRVRSGAYREYYARQYGARG